MKRQEKFKRILIRDRHNIVGYKDQTKEQAILNVNKILKHASTLTVPEFDDLLPAQMSYAYQVCNWKIGDYFYRARLSGGENWQDVGNWDRSQFWEVPAKLVSGYGRLNEPGESVFYLSTNILQTFKEIRYQKEENKKSAVVVSAFKVKKPLCVTRIGYHDKSDSVDNIYANMINQLFSLPSEQYGDNVYKLSNYLSNFYNFASANAKVFAFTPVLEPETYELNLGFLPESAHEFLDYSGSMIIPDFSQSINGKITAVCAIDENFDILDPSKNGQWFKKVFHTTFSDAS